GVVDACSGLRMLLMFFAMTTAVAALTNYPFWKKTVIFLSAIPIAFLANIFRIIITALAHEYINNSVANMLYHDVAGWLMIAVSMVLLWLELELLRRLFIEQAPPAAALQTLLAPASPIQPSLARR